MSVLPFIHVAHFAYLLVVKEVPVPGGLPYARPTAPGPRPLRLRLVPLVVLLRLPPPVASARALLAMMNRPLADGSESRAAGHWHPEPVILL